MPTGYTYPIIDDDIDFKTFLLNCARAFGACISMKENSQDAKIPDNFKPSDYNLIEHEKAKEKFVVFCKSDKKAKEKLFKEHIDNEINRINKYIQKNKEDTEKYNNMLVQVRAWKPPTKDHVNLKDFMIQQISISLPDMGTIDKISAIKKLKNTSFKKWVSNELSSLQRNIDYHKKAHDEEVERVQGRNDWIKQLRESI